MKFKKFLSLVLIVTFSSAVISCSDDDDDDKGGGSTPNFDTNVLPVSIKSIDEENNTETITFKYDTNDTKRLTGFTVVSTEEDKTYTYEYTITYSPNGLITRLDEKSENYSNYYTYEYSATAATANPNILITRKRNGNNNDISHIVVNSKGLVIENSHPLYKEVNKYTYATERNNLIKFEEYENDTLDSKVEIGYEDKAGIFRNVSTPQWFLFLELEDNSNVFADVENNRLKIMGEDYKTEDNKIVVGDKWTSEITYETFVKDFPGYFTAQTKNNKSGAVVYKTTYTVTYNISE